MTNASRWRGGPSKKPCAERERGARNRRPPPRRSGSSHLTWTEIHLAQLCTTDDYFGPFPPSHTYTYSAMDGWTLYCWLHLLDGARACFHLCCSFCLLINIESARQEKWCLFAAPEIQNFTSNVLKRLDLN
jgi:hypothetical protein